MIVAAVAALVLGGGAGWYAGSVSAPKTIVVAEEPPTYHEYAIADRIVNLADQGGRRYVKLAMVLQVQKTKSKPQAAGREVVFTTFEPVGAGTIEAAALTKDPAGALPNLPRVHDVITTVLSSKRADELITAAGKERLKEELKAAINRVLPSDQQVVKVYFTDFILQ